MPQAESVRSLQECCLVSLADNFYDQCNRHLQVHGEKTLDQLDVCSPFESMPAQLLELLIGCLSYQHPIRIKYFKFLTSLKLETLDMNWLFSKPLKKKKETDLTGLLHLISIRCPQLKVLKWSRHLNEWSLPIDEMFLPMFQKLQELDISFTKAGDGCLHVLGAYCKELRVLVAEGCLAVTDNGIKGLCAIFDNFGNKSKTLGQCTSIHTLKIRCTRVTKKGVHLALENLPDLRLFRFDFPVHILAELQEECNFFHHQLVSLIGQDDWPHPIPYKSGSLGRIALMCSTLNKVHMSIIPGLTDQELLGLLQLDKICELAISGNMEHKDHRITFDGGVVPLLKAFGNSLYLLSLTEVKELVVNIYAIVVYCPKLEYLELKNTGDCVTAPLEEEQHSSKRMRKEWILENLKTLKLYCCDLQPMGLYGISLKGLDMLLASPTLVNLTLCVQSVSDEILRKAFDRHQFRHLEFLELKVCRHVTKEGIISLFMNEKNRIKKLRLGDCESLTDEDCFELGDIAFQKNWDVLVSF